MNICLVSDDYKPALTGVGIHIQCIAEEFKNRGNNIIIITTRRKGEPEVEDYGNIVVYRFRSRKLAGFSLGISSVGTIKKILQKHQVEIVHFHYFGFLMLAGIRAAQKLKIKRILSYHIRPFQLTCHINKVGRLASFFGLSAKFISFLMKCACNSCDLVLVPSSGMVNLVKESGVTTAIQVAFYPIKKPESLITTTQGKNDIWTNL